MSATVSSSEKQSRDALEIYRFTLMRRALARRYQRNQYLPPYHRLQSWDPLEDGNSWEQLVELRAADRALRALKKMSLRRIMRPFEASHLLSSVAPVEAVTFEYRPFFSEERAAGT